MRNVNETIVSDQKEVILNECGIIKNTRISMSVIHDEMIDKRVLHWNGD